MDGHNVPFPSVSRIAEDVSFHLCLLHLMLKTTLSDARGPLKGGWTTGHLMDA